jgi:signal transduction histidine kinase
LHYSIYLRLVVLTAGTLLPFFWMVVILGHRRQRNFERIFFFLCLALVFFFGASLLALNAQLYYATIMPTLAIFSWTVLCLGLWFIPSLLVHLHVEYAQIRELLLPGAQKRLWLAIAYLPALLLIPELYRAVRLRNGFDFVLPSNSLGWPFQAWLGAALLVGVGWQWRFVKTAPDPEQKSFHRAVRSSLELVALLIFMIHVVILRLVGATAGDPRVAAFAALVGLIALMPLVDLVRNVQKFNFLQIGRQRNLVYAVFAAFLGLLYFSLIRRVSLWLEPYLPPEATAAILLFLPLAFFEPLQRFMGRILRRTAQTEMDHAQRMMGPIQEVARLGNLEKLTAFVEKWVTEQLQLAEATLFLGSSTSAGLEHKEAEDVFTIRQSGKAVGTLRVKPYGAMLSGETVAALEFLCEQLPGALDLCRLIEEKLQLERELAERERMALVGQMAASISHNLKNPLGSMKTILQVQLENPEMPESMRAETKMILEEIGRLSAKLNQLLQFSRPAVLREGRPAKCNASDVAREVVGVLRPEAQRKEVALELYPGAPALNVAISTEALNDILTNLIVNALDAAPRGGHVRVEVFPKDGSGLVAVEDDGLGVPSELRGKILQPFFTTKTQGTGLGLAIVARRASEAGGKLEFESPTKNGRGTRFLVWLPLGDPT